MSDTDLSLIQQKLRNEIGEVFFELRTEELLSQREMADRMAVPQYKVSRIERGDIDLKLSSLQKYADRLGYKIEIGFVPKENNARPE